MCTWPALRLARFLRIIFIFWVTNTKSCQHFSLFEKNVLDIRSLFWVYLVWHKLNSRVLVEQEMTATSYSKDNVNWVTELFKRSRGICKPCLHSVNYRIIKFFSLSNIQLRVYICLLSYSSLHVNMFLVIISEIKGEYLLFYTEVVSQRSYKTLMPTSNHKGSHSIKQ